jgi:hypothetical protein
MPLQDYMKIISVDDHLIEHPRVWQDRLPQSLRERGPGSSKTIKATTYGSTRETCTRRSA